MLGVLLAALLAAAPAPVRPEPDPEPPTAQPIRDWGHPALVKAVFIQGPDERFWYAVEFSRKVGPLHGKEQAAALRTIIDGDKPSVCPSTVNTQKDIIFTKRSLVLRSLVRLDCGRRSTIYDLTIDGAVAEATCKKIGKALAKLDLGERRLDEDPDVKQHVEAEKTKTGLRVRIVYEGVR